MYDCDRESILPRSDSVDQDVSQSIQQETSQLEPPKVKSGYFLKAIINFYRQPQQSLFVHDVYASLFFCDFINMIIVICFYSQFGERAAGNTVVQTIKENKVPVAFLVLLLIQFILIIIDRALYL
ncbi:unnamed protein product, partial [Rotaria sordida]